MTWTCLGSTRHWEPLRHCPPNRVPVTRVQPATELLGSPFAQVASNQFYERLSARLIVSKPAERVLSVAFSCLVAQFLSSFAYKGVDYESCFKYDIGHLESPLLG